jgi:hypothetical protein
MSNESENPELKLTEVVGELESLVKKKPQNRVSVMGDQIVPILDELVTPEGYNDNTVHHTGEDDDQQYDDIAEKVEQKLSSELDDIVNLLKGNLKDSILQELHDQTKKDLDKNSDD